MRVNCCKSCTKRTLGCHSTCKDYNDWLTELKESKKSYGCRSGSTDYIYSSYKAEKSLKFCK